MKTRKLLLVCILCLALLTISGLAAAQPPLSTNRAAATDLPFKRLFASDLNLHVARQSSLQTDSTGGLHITFYDSNMLYYGYCAAQCASPDSWNTIPISTNYEGSTVVYTTLALTSTGLPRIVGYAENPNYFYAECNGNCTVATSWNIIYVKPTNAFESSENYPKNARYFTLDAQNRPRFVADRTGGLTYAYCDSACTSASNWKFSDLVLSTSIRNLQLVFNSSSQPRVIGTDSTNALQYAQCDANCTQSASWSLVKVADAVQPVSNTGPYALRLDAQGRPRIAFYKRDLTDKALYYAWADSNFTSAASWTVESFSTSEWPEVEPAADRAVDLALDSQGRPHIVFADKNFALRYLFCTSGCNTLTSNWYTQTVETAAQLTLSDPVQVSDPSATAAWSIRGFPSLVLDSQGHPVVSYYAINYETLDPDTYANTWAIRVALGAAQYPLYLPVVTR